MYTYFTFFQNIYFWMYAAVILYLKPSAVYYNCLYHLFIDGEMGLESLKNVLRNVYMFVVIGSSIQI